ncbi:MAG: hypothetical protein U5K43_12855 [Halofilum sp. (in: g-proteobacteria)]|nr:hypothetical protein [Halofilum sp. (in: g-proteobacteria)]
MLDALPPALARTLLAEMQPAPATAVLAQLAPEARACWLDQLAPAVAAELAAQLEYPADSAGRLMSRRLGFFRPEMDVVRGLHAPARAGRARRAHAVPGR